MQKKIENEFELRSYRSKSRKIDNKSKSLNDPDALALKHKSVTKGFMYGYNGQIAVDNNRQIIVGNFIHSKAQDYEALPIMLDTLKENLNKLPNQLSAVLSHPLVTSF